MRWCGLGPLLFVAACGTIRGYDGERLPPEKRAVVTSHCASAVTVRLVELDGKQIDEDWYQGEDLELEPGAHRMTVDVTHAGLGKTAWLSWGVLSWWAINAVTARNATEDFVFHVDEGGRYIFTARVNSWEQMRYTIENSDTGEVVAERRTARPGE